MFIIYVELISLKSLIPSAKHSNLQKGEANDTLLINNENKIGDKYPPWGTPDVAEKNLPTVAY